MNNITPSTRIQHALLPEPDADAADCGVVLIAKVNRIGDCQVTMVSDVRIAS